MNRKRSLSLATLSVCVLLLALALPGALAQKKDKNVGRLLSGKVLNQQDSPLPDAIVYLTNTRTRAVKTYIVGQDGGYRFPALANAVDYEVYAQFQGHKSDTKSVSQFDDREQIYIDLKINTQ